MSDKPWIERHKVVRRFALLWAIAMSSYAVLRAFSDTPPDIPMGTATALATVLALVGTAATLYTNKRHHEDNAQLDREHFDK